MRQESHKFKACLSNLVRPSQILKRKMRTEGIALVEHLSRERGRRDEGKELKRYYFTDRQKAVRIWKVDCIVIKPMQIEYY